MKQLGSKLLSSYDANTAARQGLFMRDATKTIDGRGVILVAVGNEKANWQGKHKALFSEQHWPIGI